MKKYLNINYPQTAEIEHRCCLMLADLWHAPDPNHAIGCSTTGSSEACMLAGMAFKWRWRERMKKLNNSKKKMKAFIIKTKRPSSPI